MVKVALAGGSGQVGREITAALLASNKHDIIVLSRKQVETEHQMTRVTYLIVDYDDKDGLVKALEGVHTLLSFIVVHMDPQSKSQKNLIDAAVKAGVRRFAPSEWAGSDVSNMSLHAGKADVREYLRELNADGKILKYTLFQPGLFLDYLAAPHQTAKYVAPLQTMFDFQNRRAVVIEGHHPVFTFTSAEDVARIVAEAVDCEDEWPIVSGISGNKMPISQIIEIGSRVRGGTFTVDHLNFDDLNAGKLGMTWTPPGGLPSFDQSQLAKIIERAYIDILLSSVNGAWDVTDELNQRFPEFRFVQLEEFLEGVWKTGRE